MTHTNFRFAAVAVLAFGAALPASAALAQVDLFAAPAAVVTRPVADFDEAPVPPNVRGPYTCTFNERHTHLERRACAGTHYVDPRVID